MAQPFWRKSACWWVPMIGMLLSGTGSLVTAANRDDSWIGVVLAVVAYGLALFAGVAVLRMWIEHRQSDRAG